MNRSDAFFTLRFFTFSFRQLIFLFIFLFLNIWIYLATIDQFTLSCLLWLLRLLHSNVFAFYPIIFWLILDEIGRFFKTGFPFSCTKLSKKAWILAFQIMDYGHFRLAKKWIVEKEKGHFSWTLRTPARYARIRGSSYEAQAASSRLARPSLGLSAAHTQSCNVFLITLALAIWIRGLFGPAMHSYKVMSIVTFGFFL